MSEADEKAYEEAEKNMNCDRFSAGWKAALEYVRKPVEPVAQCGHESCDCRGYCQKLQTHPAQPVQPAGAQGEPVAYLHLISDNNDKESFVVDFNKTHPLSVHGGDYPLVHPAPAAAINQQLLEALENLALACGRNDGWEDYPQEMKAANAAIRAAEAEKAKRGEA